MVFTTSPFNLPIMPMQKTDGFWETTVDYFKLYKVVAPIATVFLDVILMLEQMDTCSGNWYVAIDLTIFFS